MTQYPTLPVSGAFEAPSRKDFEAAFNPREYLDEYFSGGLDDEDRFTTDFIVGVLREVPAGALAHEFGGGPALYSVASLAGKAREIHFSDVVPASLEEVARWLRAEPGAFDWRPYIRLSLQAEGLPDGEAEVLAREAEMRQKTTRLMICDAQAAQPLGDAAPRYDVVAANHCTDVAASSAAEWFVVLQNVASLVQPGGWLIVTVTSGTGTYTVGEQHFRCSDLTPEDMRAGFLRAGFDPESIRVAVHTVEGQREYTGIIAAAGRRPLPGGMQSSLL